MQIKSIFKNIKCCYGRLKVQPIGDISTSNRVQEVYSGGGGGGTERMPDKVDSKKFRNFAKKFPNSRAKKFTF